MSNESRILVEAMQTLDRTSYQEKPQILHKLSEQHGSACVSLYRLYLKDEDWHMRIEAVTALAKALGSDSLEEISPLLKDESRKVRKATEKAISEYCK